MASPQNLSILVLDDDPLIGGLLQALLGALGHTVTTEISAAALLYRLASPPLPDVVLSDLRMPGLQGEALAEALAALRRHPTRLMGMSASTPSARELALFDAFLQKPFTVAEFEGALTRLREDRPSLSALALTPRELEVVAMIAQGCTNRAIAVAFAISEETVKRHLTNIFAKTGVSTRLELAVFALNHKLAALDS